MEYKNLPDLKGLAALCAIVELGGVNQAAEALHIGQPAITKRLRALEKNYNTQLFYRKGRKLDLTTAGKSVYSFARLALDHQNSLLEDLITLQRGKNLLRLEVTNTIGEHLLPELLLKFNTNFPQCKIESRMDYSRRIQTRLATGLVDIALLEQAPVHPDIQVTKWRDDELILVSDPKHPIARIKNLKLEQLSHYDYVLREPESSIRLTLDKELQRANIESLPTSFEVGSTNAIVEVLGYGKHISFLPRFSLKEALKSGLLHETKVTGFHAIFSLWIAQNRHHINNKGAQFFLSTLTQQC